MKILNLYAGIGGNRLLWGDSHEITAVEYNKEIANEYKRRFPNDTVIVTDAHQYLLEHIADGWDFIWGSPPCQTHSKARYWTASSDKTDIDPVYPDMKLWQEIIFLDKYFNGKWVIENVIPYYEPLIKPIINIDRHLFWCNFKVNIIQVEKEKSIQIETGANGRFGFTYSGKNKKQILRNLVNPEIGLHFLNRAFEITNHKSTQNTLPFEFD